MDMARSIIIPAFNEEGRIGTTLASIERYFAQQPQDNAEVIVVCDGCRDRTEGTVKAFSQRWPIRLVSYKRNRGKGYAVRRGVAVSTGRVLAFMDADGATPVSEFGRLSRPILAGRADIVVGSRRARGAKVRQQQSLLRQVLGRGFAWHAQLVLGLKIRDTQCGFKVFDGERARDLFRDLSCNGFAFDLEILARARQRGLRVLEQGVEWHERPGSSVHPFRDGLRMLSAVWRIRADLSTNKRGAGLCPPPGNPATSPLIASLPQ
jgi:dolichyl-phosphate beta-glucosyltransferase